VVNKILANDEIVGYTVVVIDDNGVNKGEMVKKQAIILAKSSGYDLIQVGKNDKGLSICKFGDAGKMKFEASKKKQNSKPVEVKEMMFHIRTSDHDIGIKKSKIRGMIAKKCVVKFGIQLKGREREFVNLAKDILNKNVTDLSDVAIWDDMKVFDNSVFFMLRPNKDSAN
jgi:translation initiation factor IF-3